MPEFKEPNKGRSLRREPTTSDDYVIDAPPNRLATLDQSFALQTFMEIQSSLGKLTEAVQELKVQSREHGSDLKNLGQECGSELRRLGQEHGSELKKIGQDVYAAKVAGSAVGGILIFIGGVIAWLVNTYIAAHPAK